MAQLSRSQIDRLGERLRLGDPSRDDIEQYIQYRDDHEPALAAVMRVVRSATADPLSARLKTPDAVIAKLKRQSSRLSQIQDIAGCRVMVPDRIEQDTIATKIAKLFFANARFSDTRDAPHVGYRAVHAVVRAPDGHSVEIQLRTELEDVWAQLSEKFADAIGSEVKYGGGPDWVRELLASLSEQGAEIDRLVANLRRIGLSKMTTPGLANHSSLAAEIDSLRASFRAQVTSMMERLDQFAGNQRASGQPPETANE